METPQTRTLHRALAICGSIAGLAESLRIPVGVIRGLLDGTTAPAAKTYIRALEVVATDECRDGAHAIHDHPVQPDEEAAVRTGRDLLRR
jgi:hypothetical protein